MVCELFTWEESQRREQAPWDHTAGLSLCKERRHREALLLERAAYWLIARNIHPGQWGVYEPEFPTGGVPVSLECSQLSSAAMLSHRAWNALWKVQPSRGRRKEGNRRKSKQCVFIASLSTHSTRYKYHYFQLSGRLFLLNLPPTNFMSLVHQYVLLCLTSLCLLCHLHPRHIQLLQLGFQLGSLHPLLGMLIDSKPWVILRISVLFLSSSYTQCFWRVSYNYFDLEVWKSSKCIKITDFRGKYDWVSDSQAITYYPC